MNTLQVGDRLDHYRIEILAAEGGMASIYRALDLQTGRAVAIKYPVSKPKVILSFSSASNAKRKLEGGLIILE